MGPGNRVGMNDSGNILRRIRMLVTDADGTLFGQRPEFGQYREFRDRISGLRQTQNTAWVVCTGRGLHSFNRVARPMRVFGIEPDYIIAQHAFIFQRHHHGYWPHWGWNVRILWLQLQDKLQMRRAIPMIARAALAHNPFVHVVHHSRQRLCFRFDDNTAADFGTEVIRNAAKPFKYLQIFRYETEVDVRTIPFTKGLAVAELARHVGIPASEILVIGDGHNDISMMEINPDCRTACPSNAAPEVIEVVHRTGGHIASHRHLSGVMEIIDAYRSGTIRCELPPGFRSPRDEGVPFTVPDHTRHARSRVTALLLLAAVAYTTVLVLANFNLLPFASVIAKPYHALVQKCELIVRSFLK